MISIGTPIHFGAILAAIMLAACQASIPETGDLSAETVSVQTVVDDAPDGEALVSAYQNWKTSILNSSKAHSIKWREDKRLLWINANAEPEGFARDVALRVIHDQFPRNASIWDPVEVSKIIEEIDPPITDEKLSFISRYLFQQMQTTDAENAVWIEEQYALNQGWFKISDYGTFASTNAWLLVQHAVHRPDFMAQVLDEMQRLYPDDEVRSQDYALLYDRVQMISEKPQRYGSQFTCQAGIMAVYSLEDPGALDALRASVQLGPFSEVADGIVGQLC